MRASDSKRKSGIEEEPGLSLTSLMDIMTIILLFLLQSFSADGNLIKKDESSELSSSTTNKKATNFSTVIVTPNFIKFKMDVTKDPMEKFQTVLDDQFMTDTLNVSIPNLLAGLEEKAKEIDEREAELIKQEIDAGLIADQVKRIVLVEIDKKTKYKLITRVIATVGEAGFSSTELLTYGR